MEKLKKIVISILTFFVTLKHKVFGAVMSAADIAQPLYGVKNPEPEKTIMQLLGDKILEIIFSPITLVIGIISGIIYIYKNRKNNKPSVQIIKAILIGIPIVIFILKLFNIHNVIKFLQ